MKTIPLHSLVLMIGTSKLKEQELLEYFDESEIVSRNKVSESLFGDSDRHVFADSINYEVFRLINLKLSFGERVVVVDNNLSYSKRMNICNIAKKYGVPIYYIIHHDNSRFADKNKVETFVENEKYILSGDGVANVVDTRIVGIKPIKKFSKNIFEDIKRRGFSGITVAGDIHGNMDALKESMDWALKRNMIYLQLGDLVDYGPNSLECVSILHDKIVRGQALYVIGNHDRKIEKWLAQENNIKRNKEYLKYNNPVSLSDSNRDTVNKILSLSEMDRKIFETKFNTIMNYGKYHYNIKNFSFAHAGFDNDMFSIDTDRMYGRYESVCLYGESNGNSWIDNIKSNKTIVVGHTIKNKIIPEKYSIDGGGTVIFQDTGSGKGGFLTTTDIIIKNDLLEIQNSNRW